MLEARVTNELGAADAEAGAETEVEAEAGAEAEARCAELWGREEMVEIPEGTPAEVDKYPEEKDSDMRMAEETREAVGRLEVAEATGRLEVTCETMGILLVGTLEPLRVEEGT